MKKLIVIAVSLAVLFSLSACVPEKRSEDILIGPNLSRNENVQYDFVQLHNDTIASFEDKPQYQFISDLEVSGDNEKKAVTVKGYCLDDVTEEINDAFAAALVKYINDAAYTQDATVVRSSQSSFGSFWDKFSFQLELYPVTEYENKSAKPMYSLTIAPGEKSKLDPDVEAYEEEWLRQMEIIQRNEE